MSSHTITQHPFRIQNWCRLFGNIKIMGFQIFVRHNVISGYFNTKAEKQKSRKEKIFCLFMNIKSMPIGQ